MLGHGESLNSAGKGVIWWWWWGRPTHQTKISHCYLIGPSLSPIPLNTIVWHFLKHTYWLCLAKSSMRRLMPLSFSCTLFLRHPSKHSIDCKTGNWETAIDPLIRRSAREWTSKKWQSQCCVMTFKKRLWLKLKSPGLKVSRSLPVDETGSGTLCLWQSYASNDVIQYWIKNVIANQKSVPYNITVYTMSYLNKQHKTFQTMCLYCDFAFF